MEKQNIWYIIEKEETMKTIEIKSTKDYAMFKLSPKNRVPVRQHVVELKNAIKNENLLHLHPIVVNDQFEIISGQHRFLAAKELGVPIYYVQEQVSDDFIVKANLHQRRAKMEDSIKYYMNTEKGKDYAYLNYLHERLKISIGAIMGLFGKTSDDDYSRDINSGKFKLNEPREHYDDIVDKYERLLDTIKAYPFEVPSTLKSKVFCRAFNSFYKSNPDWDKFYHKAHVNWTMLDRVYPTAPYWLDAFNKVYGKRTRKKDIYED